MSNPHRYFVDKRDDDTYAVKGEGNERASRLLSTMKQANSKAHHFAGPNGVVEYKGIHGKFCTCKRCKENRD
jgi:Uncharacterized protein conserved in bacteria (DUF2188)